MCIVMHATLPQLPPAGGVLGDVHVYDPAAGPAGAWLMPDAAAAGGPPPKTRAGLSLAAVGGVVYSFGGYTNWPGKETGCWGG